MQNLAMTPATVHVWRIWLDQPLPWPAECASWLTAEERTRAARFLRPIDQRRFTVRRLWLHYLLGHYLHLPPEEIALTHGLHGKLELTEARPLAFNLSSSQDLALYAFAASGPVGVDVEVARPMPDAEGIVARFFAADERAAWAALAPAARPEAFLRLWTRKEAFVKAIGEGIGHGLETFAVSLDLPARLLHCTSNAAPAWFMEDLSQAPTYYAALAIAGSGWRVQLHSAPGSHTTEASPNLTRQS